MNGILTPSGKFLKCRFGEHGIKSLEIPTSIRERCLWFSSRMNSNSNDSAVGCEDWNNGITQSQYDWIIKNKEHFDVMQLMCLDMVFDGLIQINKEEDYEIGSRRRIRKTKRNVKRK